MDRMDFEKILESCNSHTRWNSHTLLYVALAVTLGFILFVAVYGALL